MVYDYTVKYNGEYYPAGVDVPEEKVEVNQKTSTLLEDEEAVPKKRVGRPPKKES